MRFLGKVLWKFKLHKVVRDPVFGGRVLLRMTLRLHVVEIILFCELMLDIRW